MLQIEIPCKSQCITSRWCIEQLRGTLHFLLYHRLQIPVPYMTLGVLIQKIKEEDIPEPSNFFLERHRKEAVDTFEQLQRIVNQLECHVISKQCGIEYAAIAFGPTAILAKEVWFIRLPEIDRTHLNENHLASLQNTVAHTILTLITDHRLSTALSSPLALTNIQVLLKSNDTAPIADNLREISALHLPRSCKTFLIDLKSAHKRRAHVNQEMINCRCIETEIRIFDDMTGLEVQCNQMTLTDENIDTRMDNDELESLFSGPWLQVDTIVKGFKDVLSNGTKIWTV